MWEVEREHVVGVHSRGCVGVERGDGECHSLGEGGEEKRDYHLADTHCEGCGRLGRGRRRV